MNGPDQRDPEKDRESSVEDEDLCLPPTRAWRVPEEEQRRLAFVDPNRNGNSHCTCPPTKRIGGDTAVLKAADRHVLAALKLPRRERSDYDRKMINRHKRELFATDFPFVYGIDRFDLRIRYWGIALDNKGAPENPGDPHHFTASNETVPGRVWVVVLQEKRHSIKTLPDGRTQVVCYWEIIQRGNSGCPRWLYHNLGKRHNLSFHSSEERASTGIRRESVLTGLRKAAETCRDLKGFRLPITIATPDSCPICHKERYKLGEYSLGVTREHLDEETTKWAIVLQTVNNL